MFKGIQNTVSMLVSGMSPFCLLLSVNISSSISIHADVQADLNLLFGTDKLLQQRASALFLLKLKEFRKLSQVAIDDIVNECDGVFSHTVQRLYAGVRANLAAAGIDTSVIEGLREVFQNVPSPFQGLETRHLQEKFFRDHLQLVVRIVVLCTMISSNKYIQYASNVTSTLLYCNSTLCSFFLMLILIMFLFTIKILYRNQER